VKTLGADGSLYLQWTFNRMVKIKSKNDTVTFLTDRTFLKFVSEIEGPK